MTSLRAAGAALVLIAGLGTQPCMAQPDRAPPPDNMQPNVSRPGLLDAMRERREERTPEVTAEDLIRIREMLPEFDGAFRERMTSLLDRADASLEFDRPIVGRRILGRLAQLAKLRSGDPVMYGARLREFKAGGEILRAAKQLRDASLEPESTDGVRYAEALAALRTAITEGHDARHAVFELELSRLEAHVDSYRARLDASMAQRSETIDQHLAEMERRIRTGQPPGPPQREPAGAVKRSGDD
ncbi:MAG: hypothetical protein AAGH71_05025 [Planctomycetota bacterium]